MRILYDDQIFSLQQRGGISRYFVELAAMLPRVEQTASTTVCAPLHINEHLAVSQVKKIGGKLPPFSGSFRVLPPLNRLLTSFLFKQLAPDILHETYYWHSRHSVSVPRVLTIFDMIHERFPEQFQGVDREIPEMKRDAVARADRIIVISESTRRDLQKYLEVPDEKIVVIPLGHSFTEKKKQVSQKESQRPYLLYVGLRGGVKNFLSLVHAFSGSSFLRREFDLLCVGGGPFTTKEQEVFRQSGVSSLIHHRRADDNQLAALYAQAVLFVYPSLYEGFGLPIVEAMHCGCPVVCSRTGSMPEIGGDAARYFNPEDVEEMRAVLEEVADSEAMRAEMRAAGFIREKLFSWQRCARQTAALYRSLL